MWWKDLPALAYTSVHWKDAEKVHKSQEII